MSKSTWLAGLAAAALIPSLASAQANCQPNSGNRVAGTVVGAGIGALLGNAISGGRTGATIVGGVGGAVAGNAIAGAGSSCANQYGYYDANGAWVPNTATAYGYYDPNGRWVENAPPPGPAAYAPPPGYPPVNPGYAPAPGYDRDAAYQSQGDPDGDRHDPRRREDWLRQNITVSMDQDALSRHEGMRLLQDLDATRQLDQSYRSPDGSLDPGRAHEIDARLDDIRARYQSHLRPASGAY